jgi:hypothetical protein
VSRTVRDRQRECYNETAPLVFREQIIFDRPIIREVKCCNAHISLATIHA